MGEFKIAQIQWYGPDQGTLSRRARIPRDGSRLVKPKLPSAAIAVGLWLSRRLVGCPCRFTSDRHHPWPSYFSGHLIDILGAAEAPQNPRHVGCHGGFVNEPAYLSLSHVVKKHNHCCLVPLVFPRCCTRRLRVVWKIGPTHPYCAFGSTTRSSSHRPAVSGFLAAVTRHDGFSSPALC